MLTGEAAVTLGAVNQGMVAGDLVNTASRLQSVAPPGSVLVGESTQRAAGRAIAFEEAGEQVLKGKAAPVPAWRALRLLAEVGGRNRAEGLEAPFVGREDELRLLKDLFLATGREARIRLVSVIGPAGIGKSRLAWEFLKYVDGLVEDTWWHSGRSPAYGEGITFWALGEMVRGRCGLLETDDEPTTRNKVRTAIQQWITDEGERDWVEGALLSLLGVESRGASEELFAAWRTFFERIAAHAPVVMVFEDLHFADSGTLDFIDHLLEWSRGVPIYVVTLARPELLEKRPDWGAGKRSFTSLYLEPLPEAAMREMLAGLIPGLPESAVAAIVARADGIPLYAVETVRMLLAEGRLTEKDGAYAPVGDLAELAVPQTLTALVAARLDGLEPADRSLVHDAAVLGQSFTTNGLSAVSGVASSDLEPRLTALVRQELFSRDTDPRSPERGQYAFVQALIREVAYNTLAKPDRKARHLAAARYFESLGSDELAGALAGHYLAAHANAAAGREADVLAAQARIALRAAADRAVALGAHDQAVAFLDQAMTVTTDPAEQGDILKRAASSATSAARYTRAEALCRQAIDLYRGLGDRVGAARATTALGRALLFNTQVSAAIELLEHASAEFADLAPDPVVVALDGMLLNALRFAERYPEALVVAERVLEAAEHRGLTEVLADALLAKGSTLAAMGRIREGIGIIKAGEDLARDAGLTASHLRGIQSRTFFELEIDNLRALAGMREGLELARRTGERGIMLRFANNVGFTAYLSGEWDEAIATLEEPLAEGVDPIQRAVMLGNALVVRASRGESIAEGLAELDRLASGIDEVDSAALKVSVFDAQGSEAFAVGRFGDARTAWHRVVELDTTQGPPYYYQSARAALWDRDLDAARSDLRALDETGVHGGVIEIRRAIIRAGLTALEGRSREAAIAYRQAIRDFEDQHLPFDASLTALDMTAFVGMSEPEVGPIAAAAREFFARVGARPFVERLDAAVGAAGTARRETDGMPIEVAASTEAAIETPSAAALPAE